MERRHFPMSPAAAPASMSASALASPNDTVRVACVGVKSHGRERRVKPPNYAVIAQAPAHSLKPYDTTIPACPRQVVHERPKSRSLPHARYPDSLAHGKWLCCAPSSPR